LVFLELWTGIHPQRLPSCLQGRPLHRSSLRSGQKRGTKNMHIFIKVGGRLRGERLSYLSMYLLYIVFLSFSQNIFSLTTLARLRFILHLKMQSCNVLYQPHLYFFYFLVSLSLTASFQNLLKTRIKLHKIAYKMSKHCLRGWGIEKRGGG